jgi:hypothetical protein
MDEPASLPSPSRDNPHHIGATSNFLGSCNDAAQDPESPLLGWSLFAPAEFCIPDADNCHMEPRCVKEDLFPDFER